MKKLMLLALLTYCASCSNPEDHATGNPDSTSFNQSGTEQNLNSPRDNSGNDAQSNTIDTSATQSNLKEDTSRPTDGTNRSYRTGGDSKKKQ